jgi:uncharacterized protein YerC
MLSEPLLAQLRSLALHAMARAIEHQRGSPDTLALGFEDRLALLVQHEIAERQSMRLAQRLRWARLLWRSRPRSKISTRDTPAASRAASSRP